MPYVLLAAARWPSFLLALHFGTIILPVAGSKACIAEVDNEKWKEGRRMCRLLNGIACEVR